MYHLNLETIKEFVLKDHEDRKTITVYSLVERHPSLIHEITGMISESLRISYSNQIKKMDEEFHRYYLDWANDDEIKPFIGTAIGSNFIDTLESFYFYKEETKNQEQLMFLIVLFLVVLFLSAQENKSWADDRITNALHDLLNTNLRVIVNQAIDKSQEEFESEENNISSYGYLMRFFQYCSGIDQVSRYQPNIDKFQQVYSQAVTHGHDANVFLDKIAAELNKQPADEIKIIVNRMGMDVLSDEIDPLI